MEGVAEQSTEPAYAQVDLRRNIADRDRKTVVLVNVFERRLKTGSRLSGLQVRIGI